MRKLSCDGPIARQSEWWLRWFVISVTAAVFLALAFVRAPWDRTLSPRWVEAPVRGRWVPANSPGTKVPSHGVRAYGQTYAIDILHPRPAGATPKLGWGLGMRRPEAFNTFGADVHAVAPGTVAHAADGARDHRSRESWPALIYLMVVEAFVRSLGGGRFVLGNHVIVDHGDGVLATSAHLHRDSVAVHQGDRVQAGDLVGVVGNSGNTR